MHTRKSARSTPLGLAALAMVLFPGCASDGEAAASAPTDASHGAEADAPRGSAPDGRAEARSAADAERAEMDALAADRPGLDARSPGPDAADAAPPDAGGRRAARRGVVRVCGRSFCDDDGTYAPIGATLFWGVWGYRHDRARLEQNLAYLADRGVDYIRILSEVGGSAWQDRASDPRWPDYDQVLAGLIDIAYDRYGLRTEVTVFGSNEYTPTSDTKRAHVDRVLRIVNARPQKVLFLEVANEYYQASILNNDTALLRELGSRADDQTSVLVALSAPQNTVESIDGVYRDSLVQVATYHFDRNSQFVERKWRPVRQPWEAQFVQGSPPICTSNEPIGPGSSVDTDDDPVRLQFSYLVTLLSGCGSYVYHSHAGVWGGGMHGMDHKDEANLSDHTRATEILDAIARIKAVVPGDLASLPRFNTHWVGHPFEGSQVGNFWPDEGGGGYVRAYAACNGGRCYTAPIGVKAPATLRAARNLRAQIFVAPSLMNVFDGDLAAGQTVMLPADADPFNGHDDAFLVVTQDR